MNNRLVRTALAVAATALLASCGGNTSQTAATPAPKLLAQVSIATPVVLPIVVPGLFANYTATASGDNYVLTDTTGKEAPRTVAKNARLRFADMTVSFDIDGAPGKLYRLYQAAFGRKPDAGGLGYWLDILDRGETIARIAGAFIASKEFRDTFGADLADGPLVETFYRNVLRRDGEAGGVKYWSDALKSGAPRADVLIGFTEGFENKGLVNPTLAGGIAYFEPGIAYVGAGAAAKLAAGSTTAVAAALGGKVTGQSVTVVDNAGKPLANVKVDFSVAANNGTLAAASAVTNASGVATVPDWTLGALPGTQTLTASVAGGVTTTITATASAPSGCTQAPAAIGYTYDGAWTAADCTDALGNRYDEYLLKLTEQTKFKMTLTGHANRMFALFDSTGRAVGDMPADPFAPPAADSIQFRYVLPAGEYRLRAYPKDASTFGSYKMALTTDFTTKIVDRTYCYPVVYTTFGVAFDEAMTATGSCSFLGDTEDRYIVILRTGDKVAISLESADFAPNLFFRDDRSPTAPVLVNKTADAPGKVEVTHTATFSGFHEIIVSSKSFQSLGKYKVTVTKQ